jgi:uncharacterized protein
MGMPLPVLAQGFRSDNWPPPRHSTLQSPHSSKPFAVVRTPAVTKSGLWVKSSDVVHLEREGKQILFHRIALQAIEVDPEAKKLFEMFSQPCEPPEGDPASQVASTMFRLGFLVDEAHRDRHRQQADSLHGTPPPAQIDSYRVVLLEGCNLACKYCFEADIAPAKRRMSRETLTRVIDNIASRHCGGNIAIHWFGGEPLLAFDNIVFGVERLQYLAASGSIRSASHALTTHGGLVTRDIAAFLHRHAFSTYVSIDGDKEVNDVNRLTRKGESTYTAAVQGYLQLRAAGVGVGFLLTPHASTLTTLARSVRHLVEDVGARRIGINTPQPTQEGWGLDGAELARQLRTVTELCRARSVELVAPSQRIIRGLQERVPQLWDCRSPSGSMGVSIAPDGQMGYCIVSWNDSTHRAALIPKFESPSDPSDAEAIRWKLRSHATATCKSCLAEMVCGGPCALEAQLHGLDELGRCAFYRTFTQETLLA